MDRCRRSGSRRQSTRSAYGGGSPHSAPATRPLALSYGRRSSDDVTVAGFRAGLVRGFPTGCTVRNGARAAALNDTADHRRTGPAVSGPFLPVYRNAPGRCCYRCRQRALASRRQRIVPSPPGRIDRPLSGHHAPDGFAGLGTQCTNGRNLGTGLGGSFALLGPAGFCGGPALDSASTSFFSDNVS